MPFYRRLIGWVALSHDRWRDPILTLLAILLLAMTFVIAPLQAAGAIETRAASTVLVLLMVAGLVVLSRSLIPVIGLVVVIGLVFSTIVVKLQIGTHIALVYLDAAAWLIIDLAIVWVTIRAVFAPGEVNYHRVIGAILIYLAIGLLFACLYVFAGTMEAKAFVGLSFEEPDRMMAEAVYFSFVVLATVGFGDIVPVHPLIRSLCNLEAIIGQLYPATLLARLVSLEIQRRH